ncbi:hypothetical protein ACFOPN_02735 [Xanthomonas hyacinthi]
MVPITLACRPGGTSARVSKPLLLACAPSASASTSVCMVWLWLKK